MWRIRFEKNVGDLGPPAGFPRLHGMESNASPRATPEMILLGTWLKTGQVSRLLGGRRREMVTERISVSALADFEMGR